MPSTVFYYRATIDLVEKLYRITSYNKVRHVLTVEPATMFYKNVSCIPRYYNYILTPNVVYVAIEYLNYQIDPFFYQHRDRIKGCCIKESYDYPLDSVIGHEIDKLFIDVLLPLMPKITILKKINVFTISPEISSNGLYRLTFVRKCANGDVGRMLRAIQNDVGTHIPNIPILVVAIYEATWFQRYEH